MLYWQNSELFYAQVANDRDDKGRLENYFLTINLL